MLALVVRMQALCRWAVQACSIMWQRPAGFLDVDDRLQHLRKQLKAEPIHEEHLAELWHCCSTPPCASTRKVRKTTVRPGPSAWTEQCLRATRGTKRS